MHVIVSAVAGLIAAVSPSNCGDWSDEIIAQLQSPITDVRLAACREARSRPECGVAGVPAPLSRPAALITRDSPGRSWKIRLQDISASPDPFSPVIDTFLDVTVLRGTARFHHTDAHGSSSSFGYVLDLTWEMRDANNVLVRRIHRELALDSDVQPGGFSAVDFDLLWNGTSTSGSLAPDGEYTWSLDALYVRIDSLNHATKIIGQDSVSGTVTIDGAVGEGMRASIEEALIARIQDASIPVRRAAIASLAQIGRDLSVSALYLAMLDEDLHDPLTRGLAAVALGGLANVVSNPDDVLFALIVELAESDVSTYRAMVARGLGRTHDDRALGPLTLQVEDESQPNPVRAAAAQAIMRIERVQLSP